MPENTKIFISSVAQDTLKSIRGHVYDTFKELGHHPEMYEKTFGPWPSDRDGVAHCLDKVKQCHMYLLFIHNKGGTFLTDAQTTVTHLEFIQAHEDQKAILVFIESSIKSLYFSTIKWVLLEYIQQYEEQQHRKPSLPIILEEVRKWAADPQYPVPSQDHVDPYVWIFLYDLIEKHKIYAEELSLGVPIDWKSYASDLLRRGLLLMKDSERTRESAALTGSLSDFTELFLSIMDKMVIQEIHDWRRVLTNVRRQICGSEIYHAYGGYTQVKVGEIKDCSAISIFKRDTKFLTVMAWEGDTDGKGFFELDDQDSFVAITYGQDSDDPMFFYQESKRMFYLTFRVGEYIISYHFPEGSPWNQEKFMDYNSDILDGIIDTHANSMIFDLMKKILGGMQSES